jgi:hypothetical protein
MKYTWKIEDLDYLVSANGNSNVVYNIHWRLIANNNGFESQKYGTQLITLSDSSTFTPYENLKESDVISWLETEFGQEKIDEMKKTLTEEVKAKETPAILSGVPWVNISQPALQVPLDEPAV